MIFLTQLIRSKKSKQIIYMICFVFLVSFATAQTGVVNNGAKIIINSGAVLKITGTGADYTNETQGGSDGRIDLDGKIELEGDWTNNATSGEVLIYVNTDGTILFNGSSQQSILGVNSTYFEKLTINNSGGLTLLNDIHVKNLLTLTSGSVTLNSNNITIGTGGSLSGSFSATRMFITNGTGLLRKEYNSTGSFTFPIGENTGTIEYSPVSFTLTSGAFSSAWVGANVTNAKHPENASPDEYLTRYWSLSSSGITSPKYNASFNYVDADIIGTEADIYAAEYDGSIRSLYGSANTASNLISVTGLSNFADYTGVDGTPPSTVISTTESDPTNANPIPFKVTFSETVSDFVVGDIVVGNGSTSNFVSTGNPEFTFDVTPSGQGEITVDVAGSVATDDAGNNNTEASQYNITYDSNSPAVTISSTEPDPTNSSFSVTITFNEEVNYFHLSDISVGNGSAVNFSTSDSTVFTADITPTTDGTVTVDVNAGVAEDNAGNGNTAATQFSITYDDNAPTVVITSSESSPTNANPIPITITFNEEVSGFALSDIVVGNGSVGALSTADNITYTAEVTPSGDGTVTVDVGANKAQDDAGNWNTAATQFSITYDGTKPDVTITSAESDPTNTTPFEITITFNENVSGFLIGDISVGNGVAGNLNNTTPNQVWTADITPSGVGEVTVDIAVDAADDDAGNGNNAATQFSIEFDNVDPTILTLNPADDEAGVAIGSDLEINFNEPVNAVVDSITLFEATGDVVVEVFDVITDISGDGTSQIIVNPTSDLSSATDYYVQITTTAFDDDAGNSFAGITDKTIWNFTAADVNSPYITAKSPTDNAVDVLITSNLEITFSEEVVIKSGYIILYDNNTDTVYEAIDVTSGQVTKATNVITINPSIDFVGETEYYVLIDDTVFEDTEANSFPGISNPATWNFTTEDVTGPAITSTDPLDDATDVAIDANLQITFDEDVAKGTGNIIITNSTLASQHESIDVTSGQVTINSNVVTINPGTDFNGESVYYVEMVSGVITDASANANDFSGISGSATWNFETEDVSAPTVTISTGESSPTNTSPFSVTLTFNEQVQNLVAGDISVTNGSASNLNTSDNITFTADITPASEDTVYVIVPAGVAQDLSGNGNTVSNEIKVFYDITSPDVEVTGTTGPVGGDFDVTITFNEGIADLIAGNITVGNGSVSDVTNVTTDSVWTATIAPTSDGTVTVKVLADAVVDIAGNGNTVSNQYSVEYDGTGPIVNTLSPTNGATDVSVSDNLTITFDETVYLNTGNIVIYYQSDDSEFETLSVSGLSGDGTNTVTIDPVSDFDSETTYYVLIDAEAFIDVLGNGFAGFSANTDWTFTTVDVEAPIVTLLQPSDESVDIAIDTNLTVTFNENVSKNVGDITIMNDDTDLEHEVIDVTSAQVTIASNVVTINPSIDLESEVNYYVLVGQSTFEDAAGNLFDGITAITDWNFMTEDLNPPVITALSPTDNSTGIATASDLEITFDENVVVNTGNITITNASSGLTHETIDVTSGQVTVTANTIIINPSVDFNESSDYYVTIPAAVISDDIGNDYGGISDPGVWNFTTGDFTAPAVSTLLPSDNAVDQPVATDLVITFNEDVVKGSGNITIYNVTAGTTHEVINVLSSQIVVLNNEVTINPSVNFNGESEYYVQIASTAFLDEAGNNFSGILTTTDWTFTTEDVTPPVIASLSPIDNATDVSIVTNFEITFNEDVKKGTGIISIINSTTSSTHESFDVSASNVTVASNTVTIDPTTDLTGLNDYYIQIASTAIKDLNDNSFAGITGTTDWNFSTADATAPYVSSYSPTDNSTGVSVSSDLVLTFSETVVANTGNITIMNASTSSTHETIDVTSGAVSIASNVVTINPTVDFEGETEYYVLIENGVFRDTETNNYGGIASSTTWNFTTEDISVPVITALTPTDDAVDVPLNEDLEIVFSENVFKGTSGSISIYNADNTSMHETISITTGLVAITDNVVTVYPSVDFNEFTNYYIQIDNNAFKDGSGNTFAGISDNSTWNFKTVDNTSPDVLSFIPEDNASDVTTTSDLAIKFNEDITVNTGNIVIMDADAVLVHETIDVTSGLVSVNDSTVNVSPSIDLEESTNYYVLIDDGAIQDLSGNSFAGIAGATTWNFTTGDFTLPTILSFEPEDGSTNITTDTNLRITFSENVVANTGLITVMNSAGTHESIDVLSAQVTINSNIVTIDPSIDFNGETDYYILIADGAFHDLAGNSFTGITDPATWNFRTIDGTAPAIVSFNPVDEATNVALNTDLQVTFNESVAVNVGTVNIMNGSTVYESIDITSGQVTITSSVVTINPSIDLLELTAYHVLIDDDAIRDISGNSFAGISDETVWNFTSADTTKPVVTITSSESGTVTDNFEITITFSEVVSGFESTDITVGNGTIGTFTETTTGQIWTVTIEPVADGEVTVDIAAGVAQDAAGNNNLAASQFSVIYNSGVGIEDIIPYELSVYSLGDKVIVEFINEGNYQFKYGLIEIYNIIGQKIIEQEIDDFVRFETIVEHVSQIYVVKVSIDENEYTKRLYVE